MLIANVTDDPEVVYIGSTYYTKSDIDVLSKHLSKRGKFVSNNLRTRDGNYTLLLEFSPKPPSTWVVRIGEAQ